MAPMRVVIADSAVAKLERLDFASDDLKAIIRTLERLQNSLEGSYPVPFVTDDPPIRIIGVGKYRILFRAREDRGLIEVLDISGQNE